MYAFKSSLCKLLPICLFVHISVGQFNDISMQEQRHIMGQLKKLPFKKWGEVKMRTRDLLTVLPDTQAKQSDTKIHSEMSHLYCSLACIITKSHLWLIFLFSMLYCSWKRQQQQDTSEGSRFPLLSKCRM